MKTRFFVTAVVTLAVMGSVGVMAQGRQYGEAALAVTPQNPMSHLTRTDIKADLLQARVNRVVPASPEAAFVIPPVASTVPRAVVRSEAVMAARKFQEDGRSGN